MWSTLRVKPTYVVDPTYKTNPCGRPYAFAPVGNEDLQL